MSSGESLNSLEKGNLVTTVVSIGDREIKGESLDQAINYVDGSKGIEIDPVIEEKMVRKIDWMLLPMIGFFMSLQLADKTTNGYAAIMGLRDDIPEFKGNLYSWVGSSFYFGVLGFQFIADRFLTRFPISKTLGIFMILWSIVLGCHAACKSASTFLVCRVLLGILESAMTPAYMIITTMWYTRKVEKKFKFKGNQQFIRTTIWFGAQGLGNIMACTIAYGLYTHRDSYSIPAWKLLYVIFAVITFVSAIGSMFHIPDVPVKAWFLNETEKKYVVERSRQNQQGFGSTKFKKYQFIEAITDIRTYILLVYVCTYALPNGGFQNFVSTLYKEDLGFATDTSLLMSIPGGVLDILSPLLAIALSYFISSSLLVSSIVNTLGAVGMILLAFSNNAGAKLFGIYTFYIATVSISCFYAYIASNINGSTKRITVHAVSIIGYCIGNITSPQTFRVQDAPNYLPAKIVMIVSFIVGTMCFLALYYLDDKENKRRDKAMAETGEVELPENYEFADLTDKENPAFRYTL